MEELVKYFKVVFFFLLGLFSFLGCLQKEENFKEIELIFQTSREWEDYSVAYNKGGDFERGFYYLNKAVEMSPIDHLGYRGWMYLRKVRDYDKALTDFFRLDSLTPKYNDAAWGEELSYLIGECYLGKKDFKTAKKYFELTIENAKEDKWVAIQTFIYLGICESNLKNDLAAIKFFERALENDENSCDAYYYIANSYANVGNNKLAYQMLERANEKIAFKRTDFYNEFIFEIYQDDLNELKQKLSN